MIKMKKVYIKVEKKQLHAVSQSGRFRVKGVEQLEACMGGKVGWNRENQRRTRVSRRF